jgi:hypothetical protein
VRLPERPPLAPELAEGRAVKPIVPTPAQVAYWRGMPCSDVVTIGGPEEAPDVIPCPAIATLPDAGGPVMRVAWQLDEVELAHLARGGTLWLSTWGGLPIHMIEVAPPPEPTAETPRSTP